VGALIKYIEPYMLANNTAEAAEDAINWAINESLIKSIRVVTDATDWELYIGSDSDFDDGMFGSIAVSTIKGVQSLIGNQTIFLDLPYIDNLSSGLVHFWFLDKIGEEGATIEVFGQKARTA